MEKYINWNVFSWQEVINILKDKKHWLNELLERWFGDYELLLSETDENKEEEIVLCFSEDCIEIEEGKYFLVNFKEDYAYSIGDLSEIEERLSDYEKLNN